MGGDHVDGDVHRLVMILVPPIARERGIEHLAEPMDDHRLLHLAEDAAVDLGVVVTRARRLHQRAARHQHDAPVKLLDRRALLLVGADDVVDGDAVARVEVIGAGAAADERAGKIPRRLEAAADQFERGRPVDAHAALGGVHGLGDTEAERPQMAAERDGALPIDGGVEPGIAVRLGIGDHVRGRVGDAVERRLGRGEMPRRLGGVGLQLAAGDGKVERGHVDLLRLANCVPLLPSSPLVQRVMRGLDPRIHLLRKKFLKMDGLSGHKRVYARLQRAMPGNDDLV